MHTIFSKADVVVGFWTLIYISNLCGNKQSNQFNKFVGLDDGMAEVNILQNINSRKN